MVFEVGGDLELLDRTLEQVPDRPAVFLIWGREGEPYLARTNVLRRRLRRLLREREKPSRLLNLRHTATRIDYQLTGSALESAMTMYELARQHFPSRYGEILHLRPPPYVKIVLANPFPRSQITTHLGGGSALYFGPFRSRVSAERFESQFLDLFQMRRCQEDLAPSPQHPGCIYGEMGMCLRPCQQLVGIDEYAHEVTRVVDFLATGGRSLLHSVMTARDRLSAEMQFEEAARQHKQVEKIQEVLKLRDEMACHIDQLNGIAVTPSAEPDEVELSFVRGGQWQGFRRLGFELVEGKPISLDRKLREIMADAGTKKWSVRDRQDYLAILARWFYSTWRDGEFLTFERFEDVPYRKVVNAISRVMKKD
jgi:excinuclease UvrABC nuclease subunit